VPVYLSPPPRSPIARFLAALVGAVLLVGAFMVGMVAFLVLLGIGLVGAAWLWFRTWRLRRTLGETGAEGADVFRRDDNGDAIEGEYTVVDQEERRS